MSRKTSIFMLLLVGIGDAAQADTSTNHNHPDVKELESQYIRYIEAESRGDIDAFLQTRTSEIAKKIAPRLNPEMLKRLSKTELHPNDAQFVRYDSSGATARIVYQKLGHEKSEWLAVMFLKEDRQWKIGRLIGVLHAGNQPKDVDGLNELLENPEVHLK